MASNVYFTFKFGKNNTSIPFTTKCMCPRCKSMHLKYNGHDTGVNGKPRYVVCLDCGKSFYSHTSYHAKNVINDLKQILARCFRHGNFGPRKIKIFLPASDATLSRLVRKIIALINASVRAKEFWSKKLKGTTLFVDETFIKISKKTWYLIAILNEHGQVVHFDFVEHRDAITIEKLLSVAANRLLTPFSLLVTDGLTSYKKVAKNLGRDIIHVEHVHEPPHCHVIIHQIHHEQDRIIFKRFATTNEILVKSNVFLVQVSEAMEKKTSGKPGRPKGSKNKAKKSSEDEGNINPKENEKANHGGGENMEGQEPAENVAGAAEKQPTEKKRPKPYRDGETRVFMYNMETHRITGFDGKPADGSDVLERLLPIFEGKHATTNISENNFSTTKHAISFSGNRDAEDWREVLLAYYTIRSCPEILDEVMEQLQISPHFGTKLLSAINMDVSS